MSALLSTGTLLVVETHGVSMLPRFRTGDVAVVMAQSSYHVGEVVAYWSPLLHVTVLHRIVAEHAGRFTFKGDNNAFLDPLRLPATAIRGSLLFRVPDPGNWLQTVELHLRLAVSAVMGTVLLAGVAGRRRARRGAPRHQRRRPVRRPSVRRPSVAAMVTAATLPLSAAGVAAAVLVAAYLQPATRATPRPAAVRQSVVFSYSATTPTTTVYPSGRVTTGMPVFTRLVPAVDVRATYHLHLPAGRPEGGTIALGATFVSTAGWTRSLGTTGPVRFSGGSGSATYHLDLVQAEGLLQDLSSETGIEAGSATIVLTPAIRARASLDGVQLSRSDAPPLDLSLTSSELLPTGGTTAGAVPHYPELTPSSVTPLTLWASTPGTLGFLGHRLPVAALRADALRALLAALLVALGCALAVAGRLRAGEARQIRARYRRELVEVTTSPEIAGQAVLDVTTMGALAQIAETAQSPLLHHAAGGADRYYAVTEATVYRYAPAPPDAEEPPVPSLAAVRPRGAHLRGARAVS